MDVKMASSRSTSPEQQQQQQPTAASMAAAANQHQPDEQEEDARMEVLQEPPIEPWTGEELSRFLTLEGGTTTTPSSTCGLRNLGNTCYLNSVLQAIGHIPVLSTYLNSGWPKNSSSPGSGTATAPSSSQHVRRDFCNFLSRTNVKMWSGEFKDFAPRNVNRTMIETVPEFSQNGQQDAEEALTYILNNLHDELFVPVPVEMHPARAVLAELERDRIAMLNTQQSQSGGVVDPDRIAQAYEPYKRSIVSDSFVSMFAQRVTCEKCKQQSLTVQECFALPLELPVVATGSSPSKLPAKSASKPSLPEMALPPTPTPPVSQQHSQSTSSLSATSTGGPTPPPLPNTSSASYAAAGGGGGSSSTGFLGTLKGMLFGYGSGGGNGSGNGGGNAALPTLDLDDCLRSFFAPETLRGEDQYYCNQCKCKVDANKTMELAHLPQVLCLQLKRFNTSSGATSSFSKRSLFSRDLGGGATKNFTKVRFPVDQPLDLSAYLRGGSSSGEDKAETEGVAKYKLIGVVRHSGSATYGHYVAQCRTPDDRWYTFDDELVSPTNENHLFQDAYILIYERLPTAREQAKKQTALAALQQQEPHKSDEAAAAAYVSREWAIKFETMCDPGPVDNLSLQCEHGLVAFPASKQVNERVMAVSRTAYGVLEQTYTARHGPLQALAACGECKIAHLEREKRRTEEAQLLLPRFITSAAAATAAGKGGGGAFACVPKPWYQKWLYFIHNDCGPLGRGPFEGAPPPGPLSSQGLLVVDAATGDQIKPNLKLGIHYVCLPIDAYHDLHRVYGSNGQAAVVVRAAADIYADAASSNL